LILLAAALGALSAPVAAGQITPDAVADLPDAQVVILGELHDNPHHHENQADAVAALAPTALVFEMLAEAQAARAAHGRGRIAGSIGPLAATYRPELHPDAATAVPLYAEMVRMVAPGADLVLFESVASLAHAETALSGAVMADSGLPVWLSVTLDDEDGTRLRSGEAVADLLPILEAGGAAAVLANCSAPEAMPPALGIFSRSGLPYGAYANGFTQITKAFLENRPTSDTLSARRDMGPEIYADHVMGWVGQGATIVGGCCETGPAHIAEIARRLREAGLHD